MRGGYTYSSGCHRPYARLPRLGQIRLSGSAYARGERVKFIRVDEQARRQLQQMVIVLGTIMPLIIILQFRREEMSDKENTLPSRSAVIAASIGGFTRCRRWRHANISHQPASENRSKKLGLPLVQFSSFVRWKSVFPFHALVGGGIMDKRLNGLRVNPSLQQLFKSACASKSLLYVC